MKTKLFVLTIFILSGFLYNYSNATLRCDGILVSCGVAAGCWDTEMSLEEYRELVLLVDAYACP